MTWPTALLGEVVDVLDSRRKPITKSDRRAGPYPYYGATGVVDWVDGFLFDEPLVLIGEDGAKWGAGDQSSFRIEGKTWVNNHTHVLRPRREIILDDWLVFFLNSADLSDYVSGMTVPKLNQGSLRQIEIPLPPLDEQKRIVAKLDQAFAALDRARANAEANLENVHSLFDVALFERLDEFAMHEPCATLAEMCNAIIDCEHKTAPTSGAGYPLIRTPNIRRGELNLEGVYRVSEPVYREWTKRAVPQPGDLIMAREAPAGNVAVIPDAEKVCLGQRTLLIKPKLETIYPPFLAHLLLHPTLQERLLSKSSGATVQHVNMKDIRMLPMPKLPSLRVQRDAMCALRAVRQAANALVEPARQKLEDIGSLRQSLLEAAFSGQLT